MQKNPENEGRITETLSENAATEKREKCHKKFLRFQKRRALGRTLETAKLWGGP